MAAPTHVANVKKALANTEPSTHGTVALDFAPRPQALAADIQAVVDKIVTAAKAKGIN